MGWIALSFSPKQYIYLNPFERKRLKAILNALSTSRNFTIGQLIDEINKDYDKISFKSKRYKGNTKKISRSVISKYLFMLLALHLVKVYQKKRARIWRLNHNWEKRLKKRIITEGKLDYGKNEK